MNSEVEVNPTMIHAINECVINRIEEDTSSSVHITCKKFNQHVRNLEATIVYMYQLTAKIAVNQTEPAPAAEVWKKYMDLCDRALVALNNAQNRFPECGTDGLYDLVLDYRDEALSRHHENSQDAEWLKSNQSNPLFQKMIGSS